MIEITREILAYGIIAVLVVVAIPVVLVEQYALLAILTLPAVLPLVAVYAWGIARPRGGAEPTAPVV